MIVEKLLYNKRHKNYITTIDGETYNFDQEIIVQYRLVVGKEITQQLLDEAIKKNNVVIYYHKAMKYVIDYGKSKLAVVDYLKEKGLKIDAIEDIIAALEKANIINDERIITGIVDSYVRRSYGKKYIEVQLRDRKFSSELISEALNCICYEDYYEALDKIYNKVKNKYSGDAYTRRMKIQNYLLGRGYTYSDIKLVHFEG